MPQKASLKIFPQPSVSAKHALVWLAVLGMFLIFIMSGCTVGEGGPGRTNNQFNGDAMVLAKALYQRGAELPSLAVRGGVNYTQGSRRHYFRFEMAAAKPGRILFTAFDPAGRPAFKLASDGRKLTGLIYNSREYVTGAATAENIARFIPLGLNPDELVALMSGAQVKPHGANLRGLGGKSPKTMELTIKPETTTTGDEWRLNITQAGTAGPEDAIINSAALWSGKRPVLSIKYSAIKHIPREDLAGRPEPFPHAVNVKWETNDRETLSLNYDEASLGMSVNNELFTLKKPDGFTLVYLD